MGIAMPAAHTIFFVFKVLSININRHRSFRAARDIRAKNARKHLAGSHL